MGTSGVMCAPRMACSIRPVESLDGVRNPLPPVALFVPRVFGWFTLCGVVKPLVRPWFCLTGWSIVLLSLAGPDAIYRGSILHGPRCFGPVFR